MQPSKIYFYRNRGQWDWNVEFNCLSYRDLWSANLPLVNKLRLSAFGFSQRVFGRFSMWTQVEFRKGEKVVLHSIRLKKWRITFYRSEKEFELDSDGRTVRLRGVEYFWPFICLPVSFEPLSGAVDESTTGASYQMPLAGTSCDCQTHLDQPEGYITIQTPWPKGRFSLTESSVERLASRLAEEA